MPGAHEQLVQALSLAIARAGEPQPSEEKAEDVAAADLHSKPVDGEEPADYLSLEDGKLVGGRRLLEGSHRGRPYLPVREAGGVCWEALQGAQTSLADELAQIEPALAKLQALPEAWAQWMTAAQKNVDVGFDRVEEARTHPALVSPATRP